MSQQLVFEFMAQRYDIFTDTERPVNADDVAVFTEVYKAYAKVREVRRRHGDSLLAVELDAIHSALLEAIDRESARSITNDS